MKAVGVLLYSAATTIKGRDTTMDKDIIETRDLGTIEGFELTAYLVPDYESDDTAAPYGVIVTASKAGLDLGSDSLWMTDGDGFHDDGEAFIHGYGPGLIAEAVEAAKAKLAELTH